MITFDRLDLKDFNELDELFLLTEKEKLLRYKELSNNIQACFVAKTDNRIVGELNVYYEKDDLHTGQDKVYLFAFRIMEKYRQKGIGQGLINYVIKYHLNCGYTKFTVGVEPNNLNAAHIYEKMGFKLYKESLIDDFDGCTYNLLMLEF